MEEFKYDKEYQRSKIDHYISIIKDRENKIIEGIDTIKHINSDKFEVVKGEKNNEQSIKEWALRILRSIREDSRQNIITSRLLQDRMNQYIETFGNQKK